jgi:hypothetical protein
MASLQALVRPTAFRRLGRNERIGQLTVLVGAGLCFGAAESSKETSIALPGERLRFGWGSSEFSSHWRIRLPTATCDGLLDVETDFPDSFNESDRFFQVLEYHRSLLSDYQKRWGTATSCTSPPGEKSWPRKIPLASEIRGLEMDYRFCKRSPNYRDQTPACHNLQFRIGAYYVSTCHDNPELQKKGYRLIKDLAEHGHADGMCYYGKV